MGSSLRAGAAVALLLLLTSAAAAEARKPVVLNVVAIEVTETFVDLGDPDFGHGDQIVFTNNLVRAGKKIGEDGGVCTVTRIASNGGFSVYCSATNFLPGGQVAVQGLVSYGPDEEVKRKPYSFAITGGTGKYRNARGEVRIKELSPKRFRVTFRIVL